MANGAATVVHAIPLKGTAGNLLNGLSASITSTTMEGAYGPDGKELARSPDGFDSEGLVRLADGTFWIGEEYGGSIAHVAADGTVIKRLVPKRVSRAISPARPIRSRASCRRSS